MTITWPERPGFVPAIGGGFVRRDGGFAAVPIDKGRPVGWPTSLEDLNSIFAPWGASFSHAWDMSGTSGALVDLNNASPVTLAPSGVSPTRNVSTGLFAGDVGCQYAEFGVQRFRAANVSDLDVTTGDLVWLMTFRLLTAPAGGRISWNKVGSGRYRLMVRAGGLLRFETHDGTTTANADVDVDHAGAAYHDVMGIVSRSGTPQQALESSLGSSSVVTPGTGSLAASDAFDLGEAFGSLPSQIITYFAWGTVPGSLIANRTAALAAWKTARGG